MKKAYGYIRVSTTSKALDGVSLDVQRERIQARCKLEGWELIGIQSDEGIPSHRMKNRPGLHKALRAVRKNKGSVLVIYNLSRMCRNTREAIDILDMLRESDCNLLSIAESLDTTTAMGKAMFEMIAIFTELQRDLASELTTEAIRHKTATGEKVGAAPYGWDWKDKAGNKKLIEVAREQRILDSIFDMNTEGASLRQIAKTLEAKGVLTKRGHKKWHAQSIKEIIARSR